MSELALIGGLVGAAGSLMQGAQARQAAYEQAAQQEAQGKEEFAAAQRDALQKRQEADLANSRVQAVAAASGAGAGADAPTIVKIMSDISKQGEYNAQTEMYGGRQRKAGLFNAAANSRRSGDAALIGSVFDAAGKAAGAFGKYGNFGGSARSFG